MANRPAPTLPHDCPNCKYLGSIGDAGWGDLGWSDLYFCTGKYHNESHEPALIVRFGERSHECTTMLVSMVTSHMAIYMQVAKKFATTRGFI